MISLFPPPHAAVLARCHRRSALIDVTEALRDALNAKRGLTAGPARLLDAPTAAATELSLLHKGSRYRLTLQRADDE